MTDDAALPEPFQGQQPDKYISAEHLAKAREELQRLSECGEDLRASMLSAAESRRAQADALMWQLPTISLTAQAFLMTIIANSTVSDSGRFLASLAALVFAVGAFQTLLRHRRNEELLSRWLEAAEILWKLPRFHDFRLMEWVARAGPAPHPEEKSIWLRRGALRKTKAFSFWAALLFVVMLADLAFAIAFGIKTL